ncbi:MAG: glutaredoxin family protein [Desulfobacteraceae bacterium]|nr:glutaredoxin family protein [Desulfobacteraceae bacterium]
MLKVYAAKWCSHCTKTIEYLKNNKIEFEYFEIEKQSKNTISKIIEVNGGDDWVVPTLEFNGKWRKGKIYNEKQLSLDLAKLGLK